MQKSNSFKNVTDFRPQRAMQTVPKIMEEIKDEHTGLVTHYLCEGNKLYEKVAYDRNFQVKPGKVRPNGYKGKSLDGRVID